MNANEDDRYYNNALQITIRNQAIIYDLDEGSTDNQDIEVNYLENIEQLLDPEKFVNTGFVTATSTGVAQTLDDEDDQSPTLVKELCTNEHSSLLFLKEKTSKSTSFTGKIYRTCTELDTLELI